jgi:hypothetical protein
MGDGSEEEVIVADRSFVVLRVQFFRSKGRVIGVLFEKIRFEGSLALNGSRKFHEEPIECGGSR